MKKKRILIAGASGMVGGALTRKLHAHGCIHLLTPTKEELDLTDQGAVARYLQQMRPEVVVISAAKVGGIYANSTYPADFLYENLSIASNLIHQSHLADVDRLLFLGSTCIYPKLAPQPIPEESLLSSALEPTNEAYALAKIVGVKLCTYYKEQYGRDYISAMPTNLYGPGDQYHPENSHVLPALIRKFHEAKVSGSAEVVIWGSGKPLRDFLYVEDLAEALLLLLESYHEPLHINVGSNEEISIYALAKLIAEVVGFVGKIVTDPSMPDGTPRKKADITRILNLGWTPRTSLKDGIALAYADFCNNAAHRSCAAHAVR
ncbi:MAG: GDP-L-fucose synthase [Chlamydiae bacterium]|nr:GDP-L-fucose synthase [Chlamydiota bacterium]